MNNDTVTISREEYESLKKANVELTMQVKWLTEQITLARKQRFGSSSEQSKYDDGSEQLSFLFNEAEVYAASAKDTPEVNLTTVKEHSRKKKRITSAADLPEDIETEIVERTLSDEELVCPQCGSQMTEIGQDVIRRLKIVSAKFVVAETHIHRYTCGNC